MKKLALIATLPLVLFLGACMSTSPTQTSLEAQLDQDIDQDGNIAGVAQN